MAANQEKSQAVEKFMANTGTERHEAVEILTRNKWDITASYNEIMQMCRSQASKRDGPGQQQQPLAGSPNHAAIDMGVGAAINLNKSAVRAGGQSVTPPPHQGLNNVVRSQGGHSPVPLTAQTKSPLIVRTGDSRGRPGPGRQPQQASQWANNSVLPPIHSPMRGTSPAAGQPTDRSRVKADLEETVQTSRPSMIAPSITRSQPVDEEDDVFDERAVHRVPPVSHVPRLKRGFSNIIENEGLVSEARHNVQVDIKRADHDNMYMHTFVLPDLTAYKEDFRAFLEKELVETSTLVSLEQAGRLNWWAEMHICQRLLPIATSGDGNCLLHAASLAMWGIHDRQLVLRKELYEMLTKASYKDALHRRWRYQQTLINKESGLVFDEPEWAQEWQNILRLASPVPRGGPNPTRSNNCCDGPLTHGGGNDDPVVYESLEEFHVFVLAHVLQRPIIVVSDTILHDQCGEALAPIPFPGIYLPLESKHFHRAPLLLTYDAAHFSALCTMKQDPGNRLPAAIPLVHPDRNQLLPLHFFTDPGPKVDWAKGQEFKPSYEDRINVLQKFMDVSRIPAPSWDYNGDSDRGSCGSQDSDETGMRAGNGDRRKEDKKKDAKGSQQMNTVAYKFGSIGKSMGKKLKQFGKKNDKSGRGVVHEVTQSTKALSIHEQTGGNGVLVAHLSLKGSPQQEQLVDNYLENARERFQQDRALKQRNEVELRQRMNNASSLCKTQGCNAYGTPQTSYLCSRCYNLKVRTSAPQQPDFVYNTFPGRIRQQGAPASSNSEEIFRYGKSKFYTSSNEDLSQQQEESLKPPDMKSPQSRLSAPERILSRSSHNVSAARHPSPDYDNNVASNRVVQGPARGGRVQEVGEMCRNPQCRYYGNAKMNGFCRDCYHRQYAGRENSTHTKL